MARNIYFGYRNLIMESGVVLTEGDEAGDHVAENLLKPHPSSFWRADLLTASYMGVDLGGPRAYNLAAALYSTATPRRNLLATTNDLTAGKWATSNASVQVNYDVSPPAGSAVHKLTATGGAVSHYIHHSYNLNAYAVRDTFDGSFLATIVARRQALANIRLQINEGASSLANVDVDLSDGSIQAGSGHDARAVTDLGDDWYRIDLSATYTKSGIGTSNFPIYYYVYLLDAAYASTFTPNGGTPEAVYLDAPKFSCYPLSATRPSTETYEENTSTAPGARMRVWTGTSAMTPSAGGVWCDGLQSCSPSENNEIWDLSLGWSHAWTLIPSDEVRRYLLFEFHDADNADSQVDVSVLWVGKAFQPATNYESLSINPVDASPETVRTPGGQRFIASTGGERVWRLSFLYATQADAYNGFHEMGTYLQLHSPLFALADPDELVHGQYEAIYGTLERIDLGPVGVYAGGPRWPVEVVIRELRK